MTDDERLLLDWMAGETDPAADDEIERRIFEQPDLAATLESVLVLAGGVRALARAGRLQVAVTASAVEKLVAAGLSLRTYRIEPERTVPCSIAAEDYVVTRLAGAFAADEIDLEVTWELEGHEPRIERLEGVPVDRGSGEVVLLGAGDPIRALPRTKVEFRVVGPGPGPSFRLEHTPSRA